jgi:maleate isomerase
MRNTDATDWRGRIGLLTPHFDLVPELEFCAMAPEGVSIHAGRVLFGVSAGATVVGADAARAMAEPPYVDDAAEQLAAAPIDVVVFGFTSSSYLSGADADAALKERLEERTKGIPVVVPCVAAVSALRQLGIDKIALVNPPWFPAKTDELGAKYFQNQGIEVVYHAPAEIEFGELPSGQIGITRGAVYEWVRAHVPEKAEAVFIGGNGFRAIEAIEDLEKELGRPVLTANQVALWQSLNLSDIQISVSGYGQILAEEH